MLECKGFRLAMLVFVLSSCLPTLVWRGCWLCSGEVSTKQILLNESCVTDSCGKSSFSTWKPAERILELRLATGCWILVLITVLGSWKDGSVSGCGAFSNLKYRVVSVADAASNEIRPPNRKLIGSALNSENPPHDCAPVGKIQFPLMIKVPPNVELKLAK